MKKSTLHRSKYAHEGLFECERITSGDIAGGYHCWAIIKGTDVRVYMNYLYYTKREAVAKFKEELQQRATHAILF